MRLIVIALVLIGTAPASAQDPTPANSPAPQPRCWLGNMGYSPGATMRAGNAVMDCGADYTWHPSADWAAGCIHEGRFHSVGDMGQDLSRQQTARRCRADGTWDIMTAGNPG